MKLFRHIFLIWTSFWLISCDLSNKPIDTIPAHTYFTNSRTIYEDFLIDPMYLKKIGQNTNDTLLILTDSKLIYIIGQYGIQTSDSIIIPYSGEFGINYEVIDNKNINRQSDTIIKIGNQKFIQKTNVNFQWWDEIKDKICDNGKGSVIVSGP